MNCDSLVIQLLSVPHLYDYRYSEAVSIDYYIVYGLTDKMYLLQLYLLSFCYFVFKTFKSNMNQHGGDFLADMQQSLFHKFITAVLVHCS